MLELLTSTAGRPQDLEAQSRTRDPTSPPPPAWLSGTMNRALGSNNPFRTVCMSLSGHLTLSLSGFVCAMG